MPVATKPAPLLQLAGVTVAYRQVEAVKGVTFDVAPGELIALVGAPGSGRSTLVLAIAGVLRPRAGTIRFAGRSIAGLRPDAVARLGLANPESLRIFPEATVEENLRRAAAQRPAAAVERGVVGHGVVGDLERWLAAFPSLAARRRALARTLDPGAQAQLALARGLMAQPRLLLLDEPFAGQSVAAAEQTAAALRAARDEGVAVLFADGMPPTVPGLPDRLLRVEGGRVVASRGR